MKKIVLVACLLLSTTCFAETQDLAVNEQGSVIDKRTGKELSLTLDPVGVTAVDLKPMIDDMLSLIKSNISYPVIAKKRGDQGVVFVKFTMSKTAGLSNVELSKSSGYKSLDSAALKAVNGLSLEFIPSQAENEVFNMEVPVHFSLRY